MGIVQEVGSEVKDLKPGDRVVVPFNISCGHCFMCRSGLMSQCETTQVREHNTGGSLFGYTKLYGQIPGGQAEFLRVPQAQFGPILVPEGPSDDRFLYLSDVLPTAWQAVEYAEVPEGGSLLVLGLGPIGEMCCRVAQHRGAEKVIAIDLVPERLERAQSHGVITIDLEAATDSIPDLVRELTDGRGPDSVIDAVGMEAHGATGGKIAQRLAGALPDAVAQKLMMTAGVDRLSALHLAIELVRRGGTVSLSGVYGGATDPMPLMQMFDKQIKLTMGQANVRRWIDQLLPLLTDDDPLGVDSFATHHLPLEQAPHAYDIFQKKQDGAFKVVLNP